MTATFLLLMLVVLGSAYLHISELGRAFSAAPHRGIEDLGHCATRRLDEVDALEALYQLPATGTETP